MERNAAPHDFHQVMENSPIEFRRGDTLRRALLRRFRAIDGEITLRGLHWVVRPDEDHPRFREPGWASSSPRCVRCSCPAQERQADRLPDYWWWKARGWRAPVLAWTGRNTTCARSPMKSINTARRKNSIPSDPAGALFHRQRCDCLSGRGAAPCTGGDTLHGRKECGCRPTCSEEYFKASESDIEVNGTSPTGYPDAHVKKQSSTGSGIRPLRVLAIC